MLNIFCRQFFGISVGNAYPLAIHDVHNCRTSFILMFTCRSVLSMATPSIASFYMFVSAFHAASSTRISLISQALFVIGIKLLYYCTVCLYSNNFCSSDCGTQSKAVNDGLIGDSFHIFSTGK